jgi:hypothetical protein
MLHLQSALRDLLLLLLIVRAFDLCNTFLGVTVFRIKLKDLGVGDKSFLRLSALLIKYAQVVPYFSHLRVQSGTFDDILKGVSVVPRIIVENGESGPVDCLPRALVCRLLEVLKSLFIILEGHEAATEDVGGVRLSLIFLFRPPHIV